MKQCRHGSMFPSLKLQPCGLILQDDVQSVNDTGNVTQDSEENLQLCQLHSEANSCGLSLCGFAYVDEEVSIATTLKEDTKRWKKDGEDDLNDVAKEKEK